MQHELIKINYQLKPFFHYFQKQHLINRSDSLKSPVESPSCHNGFPLDLELEKNKKGVATNLFCLGVIGHRKVYLSIKIKIN